MGRGRTRRDTAALEAVLAELRRRFGPWVVRRLSELAPRSDESILSTGSLGLDHALGRGGLPRGQIAEYCGPATSGKSTLSAHLLARAQQAGGFVAFVDGDQAADYEQMARVGVDLGELLVAVPATVREAFDIARLLLLARGLDAIVLRALVELARAGPGGPAAFAQGLRVIQAGLLRAPTVVLFLTHPEDAHPDALANGRRALRHVAGARVQFAPVEPLRHPSGDLSGLRVRAAVVKQRRAGPSARATVDLRRDGRVDTAAELFDGGLASGLIRHHPLHGYVYGDQWLARGRAQAAAWLEREPALAAALEADLRAAWGLPPRRPSPVPTATAP